jgi:ABC-type Fe3+-hydroxamate transport system substrate-binding protein
MIFKDQLGNSITLKQKPVRIISIVPSQTELLFSLGLKDYIFGITKFCIHPKDLCKSIVKIGGTKNLNISKILALKPDIVFANKEENVKEQIDILKTNGIPVWTSEVKTLEDALQMIQAIGLITETHIKAKEIAKKINEEFATLSNQSTKKVTYLIWKDPYMTIGSDTFIHDLLSKIGMHNVFEDKTRYPTITLEEIRDRKPDIILLSSEPFPFKEKHLAVIKEVIENVEVRLVDGTYFSWYGSKLLESAEYFKKSDFFYSKMN